MLRKLLNKFKIILDGYDCNSNALIEGLVNGYEEPHYRMASLDIPRKTGVINDGTRKYILASRTFDFQNFSKIWGNGGIETKVNPLKNTGGTIVPFGHSFFMDYPRAIVLGDGRIFIESDRFVDLDYRLRFEDFVRKHRDVVKG